MKIGYARTSTTRQEAGLAAQLRDLLQRQGCEEIFQEQVSAVEDTATFAGKPGLGSPPPLQIERYCP